MLTFVFLVDRSRLTEANVKLAPFSSAFIFISAYVTGRFTHTKPVGGHDIWKRAVAPFSAHFIAPGVNIWTNPRKLPPSFNCCHIIPIWRTTGQESLMWKMKNVPISTIPLVIRSSLSQQSTSTEVNARVRCSKVRKRPS